MMILINLVVVVGMGYLVYKIVNNLVIRYQKKKKQEIKAEKEEKLEEVLINVKQTKETFKKIKSVDTETYLKQKAEIDKVVDLK